MADYLPLISRAVAGLEKNTADARRALYERARAVLVTQLQGVTPVLQQSDIAREQHALEEAIRQVERQNAGSTISEASRERAGATSGREEDPQGAGSRASTGSNSGKIFISYRRDDSAGHAGRVHDRLVAEFGRDLLFMDVDAIPLGSNFVKVLKDEVARCDVLLAVIGPQWLDARDKEGHRRLENPSDFVRVEIGAALQRDIPVIPILLEGVSVPKADELPPEMRELSSRNGLHVRHVSFHQDMDTLIRFLRSW